jgi:uncharacterized cofD-like protein
VGGLDPADPGALSEVVGQVAVATTPGQVVNVRLRPHEPPACPDAVHAIRSAEWVVLGPGSWFTSVLPHLLVPEIVDAVVGTAARRAIVLNISPQQGETTDFSPETHLEVLAAYAPGLEVDVVIANAATTPNRRDLVEAARTLGAEVVFAAVGADDGSPRHDPAGLATVYRKLFSAGAARRRPAATAPVDGARTRAGALHAADGAGAVALGGAAVPGPPGRQGGVVHHRTHGRKGHPRWR